MMERAELNGAADDLSVRVVEAIASATGTDAFDMEPPLYEAIDPEALDRLFRPDSACRVTFEYDGRPVEVRSDGTVSIGASTENER